MTKLNNRCESSSSSPYKGTKGIQRLINATGYSLKGFCSAWQNESAFRQEAILAAVLTPLAFLCTSVNYERALLLASLLLVLVIELLNSAIEAVTDRIGLEHHELSGRAKDMGSAAVFISLLLVAITWGLILW